MTAVATEQINLNWQNFSSTVSGSFQKLRNNSELFDITLAACTFNMDQPTYIKAHKVVLAASSPVLKNLMVNMDGSSNGMLYLSGIEGENIKSVLDFIYSGQVNVESNKLDRFLQVAEELKVEGLIKDDVNVMNEDEPPQKFKEEPEQYETRPRKRRRKEEPKDEQNEISAFNNETEDSEGEGNEQLEDNDEKGIKTEGEEEDTKEVEEYKEDPQQEQASSSKMDKAKEASNIKGNIINSLTFEKICLNAFYATKS